MNIEAINWQKTNGLIPAIIQDAQSLQVLMLGYMNKEALTKTLETKKVVFFSRSKNRLWEKGESSGHFLHLVDISLDCDQDSLLLQVNPAGPCCHLQTTSCFTAAKINPFIFLTTLIKIIAARYAEPREDSYTSKLFKAGTERIAQKVGEEGVEIALAAVTGKPQQIINEAADLIYHLLVLLRAVNVDILAVINELQNRHQFK